MAKVFGMHALEVKPDVPEDQVEAFLLNEVLPAWKLKGETFYLLKGIMGERTNKYFGVHVWDDQETFEHYYPPTGGVDPEYWAQIQEVFAKMQELVVVPDPHYTDYIVLGEVRGD